MCSLWHIFAVKISSIFIFKFYTCILNFIENIRVKRFWKSVDITLSYDQKSVVLFFETQSSLRLGIGLLLFRNKWPHHRCCRLCARVLSRVDTLDVALLNYTCIGYFVLLFYHGVFVEDSAYQSGPMYLIWWRRCTRFAAQGKSHTTDNCVGRRWHLCTIMDMVHTLNYSTSWLSRLRRIKLFFGFATIHPS